MFHKRSEDVDAIRKNELDILISELLDSALLGEGWLLVLRNIFERELLRKNHFSIVPNSAKIYLQLLDAGSSVLDAKDRRAGLYGEAITSDGFSRLMCSVISTRLKEEGKLKQFQNILRCLTLTLRAIMIGGERKWLVVAVVLFG